MTRTTSPTAVTVTTGTYAVALDAPAPLTLSSDGSNG